MEHMEIQAVYEAVKRNLISVRYQWRRIWGLEKITNYDIECLLGHDGNERS
jgi:hypothetical protein